MDRPRTAIVLDHACRLLNPTTPDVRAKERIVHVAEELKHEAVDGRHDLLVIGYKPRGNYYERLLSRSIAFQVVEPAPSSVIIAKGRINPIHRALLCDRGAKNPSLITHFATQLAKHIEGEGKITILHVISQINAGLGVVSKQQRAEGGDPIREEAHEGKPFKQDVHILNQSNLSTIPKLQHGLVLDEILDEARSGDIGVVVIGATRVNKWQRVLLDNLANQIIDRIDRPVTVMQSKDMFLNYMKDDYSPRKKIIGRLRRNKTTSLIRSCSPRSISSLFRGIDNDAPSSAS